jgi:prevent-host-death family protein
LAPSGDASTNLADELTIAAPEAPMINVHDAKTHFSKLLDLAHSGQDIVLAKAGVPYARLVPIAPQGERQPGRVPEIVDLGLLDPLTDTELDDWTGR